MTRLCNPRLRAIAAALGLALAPAPLLAQGAGAEFTETLELAPLDCRWRADAAAVRVGQPFGVVLTCAVLETASTLVAPDQSRLDPSVVDLQPFEVTGGRVGRDVRTPGYRHFQYEYELRYFGELFGAEIAVPAVTLTYRVQSRLESGETIEGREQEYALPPLPIRILSIVPASTLDIREPAPATFADVDAQRFRARALDITGLALLVLAGATALWGLARVARRPLARAAGTPRLASETAVLYGAAQGLAAVRRERQAAGGWSPALAARALASLRIAAAVETGRILARLEPAAGEDGPGEGRIEIRAGWLRRPVWASGSATAGSVAAVAAQREASGRGAARLRALETGLAGLTARVYGRETAGEAVDAELDAAIDAAERVLRAQAVEHLWPVRTIRHAAASVAARFGRGAWAR